MKLISPETLKEIESIINDNEIAFSEPNSPPEKELVWLKQLIHDAKVARVAVKLSSHISHSLLCDVYQEPLSNNCTCGLSKILKELDELEKE